MSEFGYVAIFYLLMGAIVTYQIFRLGEPGKPEESIPRLVAAVISLLLWPLSVVLYVGFIISQAGKDV